MTVVSAPPELPAPQEPGSTAVPAAGSCERTRNADAGSPSTHSSVAPSPASVSVARAVDSVMPSTSGTRTVGRASGVAGGAASVVTITSTVS